jgi:hypothetical protein
MIDKRYLVDGKIAHKRITLDIRDRVLKRPDIEKLVDVPDVKSAFAGSSYEEKTDPKCWDREYLVKLSYAASPAGSFNPDYLFYLDEVAEYVTTKEKAKATRIKIAVIAGAIIVLVIIAGIVVYRYKLHKTDSIAAIAQQEDERIAAIAQQEEDKNDTK